jgi:cytoskeletal protein RodZ
MSNSTRQGDYDDLVVPLEASRRGAHRARINPLVAALPLLAVVIVVAGVIGVAYALFLKPSNTVDTGSQSLPTVSSTPPSTSAPAAVPSSTSSRTSAGTSSTSSPTPSAGATGRVDKSASITVYNGSTSPRVTGLAARTVTLLKGAGWSGATVSISAAPNGDDGTTRIYYATSDERASAEAVKQALGGVGVIRQNAAIAGHGMVVVVGNDVHP